jgi:hypothetical protein
VGDATTPFVVTFIYRLTGNGQVEVAVDSQPWSIVKKGGLSMGRTPRTASPVEGTAQYEFISPGKETSRVTIKFTP